MMADDHLRPGIDNGMGHTPLPSFGHFGFFGSPVEAHDHMIRTEPAKEVVAEPA